MSLSRDIHDANMIRLAVNFRRVKLTKSKATKLCRSIKPSPPELKYNEDPHAWIILHGDTHPIPAVRSIRIFLWPQYVSGKPQNFLFPFCSPIVSSIYLLYFRYLAIKPLDTHSPRSGPLSVCYSTWSLRGPSQFKFTRWPSNILDSFL